MAKATMAAVAAAPVVVRAPADVVEVAVGATAPEKGVSRMEAGSAAASMALAFLGVGAAVLVGVAESAAMVVRVAATATVAAS